MDNAGSWIILKRAVGEINQHIYGTTVLWGKEEHRLESQLCPILAK